MSEAIIHVLSPPCIAVTEFTQLAFVFEFPLISYDERLGIRKTDLMKT